MPPSCEVAFNTLLEEVQLKDAFIRPQCCKGLRNLLDRNSQVRLHVHGPLILAEASHVEGDSIRKSERSALEAQEIRQLVGRAEHVF